MQPNIELNIEQLLLHGFSKQDAHYIGQAMRQELTRLIQEGGLPPSFSNEMNIGHIKVGDFNVSPSAKPTVIGNQLAANVYAGFSPTPSTK